MLEDIWKLPRGLRFVSPIFKTGKKGGKHHIRHPFSLKVFVSLEAAEGSWAERSAEHRSGQMIIGIWRFPRPHPRCEDQLETNQSSKDRNPASHVFSLETETNKNKRKDRASPSLYQSLEGSDLSLTQGQTLLHGPLLVILPPSVSFLHLEPHHVAFLCSNILDSFGIPWRTFFLSLDVTKVLLWVEATE